MRRNIIGRVADVTTGRIRLPSPAIDSFKSDGSFRKNGFAYSFGGGPRVWIEARDGSRSRRGCFDDCEPAAQCLALDVCGRDVGRGPYSVAVDYRRYRTKFTNRDPRAS